MLIRNHLNYRISASLRAESFRRLQAFSLNEVQNNHLYKFHEDSKSAIVLQYDIWNTWVNELERLLLNMESQEPLSHKMNLRIVKIAKGKYKQYLRLLEEESDMFSPSFVHIHKQTNAIMMNRFLHKMCKCEGKSQIDAIVYLTKCLESFLHSSLYELQEVDYLVFNYGSAEVKEPFVSIDQQDLNDDNNKSNCSVLERTRIYLKEFSLEKIVVKSYIDAPCNLDNVIAKIQELGLKLIKVVY